jgi:PAP2 superfamily
MTPPGHSYNLANITIKKAKPNLIVAAQTYAKVGLAVADAFITCWKIKYDCHVERPSSYIRGVLMKSWSSFFPEPAFPAFTSGHATQSAAAATVLTSIYGANFAFTDDTHKGRKADFFPPVDYKPRNFKSFSESAEECAMSRLYGQIHTRQDNNVGLQEGKKVGANINALAWKK